MTPAAFAAVLSLLMLDLAAQAPSLRLRIADVATRKPCPGAVVHVLAADHPGPFGERDPFETEPDRFARLGQRLVADADGIVTVPDGVEIAAIGVRTATGWGSVVGKFEPRRDPYVVGVRSLPSVNVRIVDAEDRPSPATLTAVCRTPSGYGGTLQVRADPATGIGVLHTASVLGGARHPYPFGHESRVDAGDVVDLFLDMVTAGRCVASLETDAVMPTDLVVRVPAAGAVVVSVRGPAGGPIRAGYVWAVPLDKDGERLPGLHTHAAIRDGVARFPSVALGLQLELQVSGDGAPVRTRVAGPVKPGEEVAVDVELAAGHWGSSLVSGRLRLPAGTPARPRLLTVSQVARDRTVPGLVWSAAVAADGTFELQHASLLPRGERLLLATSSTRAEQVDLCAEATVVDRPGAIDLGEVVMQPATLLCSGRVVDEHGDGVRANVHLTTTDGVVATMHGGQITTDRDGRFAIHAARAPDRSLQLQVFAAEMVSVPEPRTGIRPGTRDVELRVARGHVVTGAVVIEDDVPVTSLTAELVLAARYGVPGCGFDNGMYAVPRRLLADGSFRAGNVGPGTYHLVFAWGGAFEIGKVENVVVGVDGKVDDARLHAVDLRGTLRPVKVVVEDEVLVPGMGNQDLVLRRVPETAPEPHLQVGAIRTALRGRPQRVLLPHGRFEVFVETPGHTSDPVEVAGDEVRIRMRPK